MDLIVLREVLSTAEHSLGDSRSQLTGTAVFSYGCKATGTRQALGDSNVFPTACFSCCWQGTGKSLRISSHRDRAKSEPLPTGLLPPQPVDIPWSQRNSTGWCSHRNTGPAAQFLKIKLPVLANIIICTVCKLLAQHCREGDLLQTQW